MIDVAVLGPQVDLPLRLPAFLLLADPGAEGAEELRLAEVCPFQKADEFRQGQEREGLAAVALAVGSTARPQVDGQLLSIPAPDFRHAQRRVDRHAIQGAATDLD